MSAPPRRALTLFDVTAIAVNGIVGSGIFRLSGPLALKAGVASIFGILACGALCILLGLCFAELAGMFDHNGGPFLYAREAFGTTVGFAVGWLCLFNAVLGYAAVAVGFGDELAQVWPALDTGGGKTFASLFVVLFPALINVLGVKAGARTTDLLTVTKLLPLLALALVGIFHLRWQPGLEPQTSGTWRNVTGAAFTSVFLFSGFEFATVPSGEVKNARAVVGRALVLSLLVCTVLYALLQWVTLSVVSRSALEGSPLVDAAVTLFGHNASRLLQVGALVSMAGYCAGSALVAPRYFSAMAEAGHIPRGLAQLNRYAAPGAAVLLCALCAAGLVLVFNFASLVDLTSVSMLSQYFACTLAVWVLRLRRPSLPRQFRLPGGPTIPILAAAFCLALLVHGRPGGQELLVSTAVVFAGFGVWGLTALLSRTRQVP